jgi:hypothetical protein
MLKKGLQQCLNINCCGIFWHLVSYAITSSAMKTSGDPDNPKPADAGDIQMEYFCD